MTRLSQSHMALSSDLSLTNDLVPLKTKFMVRTTMTACRQRVDGRTGRIQQKMT